MEASAATPTTVTCPTLLNNNDTTTTTQDYEQEEVPLNSGIPLVDEEATPLNDDGTTTQEFEQSRTPLVDGGEVGVVVNLNDEDVHATMARTTVLPKYVIIQSNQNHSYLRYNGENPVLPNALRFNGDYSFGLETRFEVVPSTTVTGFVHIRCLRNNKYLVSIGIDHQWVTARADKPEEDQTNRGCTLFRPVFMGYTNNNPVGRLQHVYSRQFVRRYAGETNYEGVLTVLPKLNPNDKTDEFTFIDWESVVMLPDRIRIKGDNGYYLCAWGGEGFMDYNLKPDNSGYYDFDVSPSRDGGIRLKSVFYNEWYWTDMDDSVWVLLKKPPSAAVHNTNTVFFPTIVGDKRIVMRSLKSNMFCNRYTEDPKTNCLAARNAYPDEWSYMEIEEPVISRRITDVRYHLADARIYNRRTFALITDEVSNRTLVPQTSKINIEKEVSNTTNWTNSTTFKAGFKMTFQAGVPLVSSGGFEISGEISQGRSWGETETETVKVGAVRSYTVPSMSRVSGKLMATRASYDIPFSYTQRDQLANGHPRITYKNDGLFTGADGYGYEQDIRPLPLDS